MPNKSDNIMKSIHFEIFEFSRGYAHGAIWLEDGRALPFSMPIASYEMAVDAGIFKKISPPDELLADLNGALNESPTFVVTELYAN